MSLDAQVPRCRIGTARSGLLVSLTGLLSACMRADDKKPKGGLPVNAAKLVGMWGCAIVAGHSMPKSQHITLVFAKAGEFTAESVEDGKVQVT